MATNRRALIAVLALLWACGSEAGTPGARLDAADGGSHVLRDGDGDGLCDITEDDLGTDPSAADSDRDGLPDVIELVNALDPRDSSVPAANQVARLAASASASIDFEVRATIDGDGQGVSGFFQTLPAAYADGFSAADFFAGALALSASPSDAVRSIDAGSAHFGAVLGRTRLAFSLRFEYPWEVLEGELDCARAYPFRYAIKTDDGEPHAERLYVLVVSPMHSSSAQPEFCLPLTCQ